MAVNSREWKFYGKIEGANISVYEKKGDDWGWCVVFQNIGTSMTLTEYNVPNLTFIENLLSSMEQSNLSLLENQIEEMEREVREEAARVWSKPKTSVVRKKAAKQVQNYSKVLTARQRAHENNIKRRKEAKAKEDRRLEEMLIARRRAWGKM